MRRFAFRQEAENRLIRAPAVKIIGVDDGKRTFHHAPAAGHRVRRAPWLSASLGNREPLRQAVQLLIDIVDMEPFFHARADCLAERLLDFALDDESYPAEARLIRVIERKVDDEVPFLVYRCHLLEPAEAAAHSGCHDDKRRFVCQS